MREKNDLTPSSITARILSINISESILYARGDVINSSSGMDYPIPTRQVSLVHTIWLNVQSLLSGLGVWEERFSRYYIGLVRYLDGQRAEV